MKLEYYNINEFIIYLNNDYMKRINLNLEVDAHKNFESLLKKLKNIYKLNLYGYYKVIVYTNEIYGMILEMVKEDDEYIKIFGESLDLKILFRNNSKILYEIDTYENYNIGKTNIYYYDNKFYLEILTVDNYKNYLNLLEDAKIIYGTKLNNILTNMIKI